MSGVDGAMIGRAKARGPVIVTIDGRDVDAFLIAWKPHRSREDRRRRNTARVMFRSGAARTVPTDTVRVP